MAQERSDAELLATLGDFTNKDNWDKFFALRTSDQPFEWYADWPSLQKCLLPDLLPRDPAACHILVPGCGNSRISEFLYDVGFRNITNIDFSKVVVSDMLRRHLRARPEMKWRVMDMTCMQFTDGSFDVVLDKGGLDALMEPQHGPKFGSKYLSEVKRVLKLEGEYVCFTLAESHVLELLFSKFRFGWKTDLHAIPQKPSSGPKFQTFMVKIKREHSTFSNPIELSFDLQNHDYSSHQGRGLLQALETENKLRGDSCSGVGVVYSIEDLQLGVKGDLKQLIPGRRAQLTLGDHLNSRFSYKAVLLDAQHPSEPFLYQFGVFLVPMTRAREWLFSSEEGQWIIVDSSRAARLIVVLLDVIHSSSSMEEIQKDLSPLVKELEPENGDSGAQIPFLMANDGVEERKIIQQVTSATTGQITVEDVTYANDDNVTKNHVPPKGSIFRRLTFERSLGLVQSEALLISEGSSQKDIRETMKKKTGSSSKNRKKQSKKSSDYSKLSSDASKTNLKIDHSYLASSYHSGVISGLSLIATKFQSATSASRKVRMVIVGLGAGLLPTFLHHCMPVLDIEVVELDPVIFNIARDCFEFKEDEQLKVRIADGVQFLKDVEADVASSKVSSMVENIEGSKIEVSFKGSTFIEAKDRKTTGIDILIIDADASDLSTGLTCPPAAFTDESFLLSVKECLSDGGLFVINLVSRSESIREMVISRIKTVFGCLFYLELEEDLNKVLFALPVKECVHVDDISTAVIQLQKLMTLSDAESMNMMETAKKIKCL